MFDQAGAGYQEGWYVVKSFPMLLIINKAYENGIWFRVYGVRDSVGSFEQMNHWLH